jgi:hypothetical protein
MTYAVDGHGFIVAESSANLHFIKCDFQKTGASWTAGLFNATGSFDANGATIRFDACDFTDLTTCLISSSITTDATNVEPFVIEFHGCAMAASTPILQGDIDAIGVRIKAAHCSDTSAGAETQWFFADIGGDTESSTSSYRNESVAFPGGNKASLVIDTTTQANAALGREHSFQIPTRFAELSNTATDLITIYLSCNDALTDADIWFECLYPDGTNKNVFNRISTRDTDYMGAGTALTTDSGSTWTSGGSNKYRVEIDTSSDAGYDAVPVIWVFVAKQTTIYLDTQIDLS